MPQPALRERAAQVLLGQLPAELEAHTDKPPSLRPRAARRAAARLLADSAPLGPHESAALLRAALTDADPHVRVAALDALVAVSDSALYGPVLHACALDAHALVREAAYAKLVGHETLGAERALDRMPPRAAQAATDPAPSSELVIDGH